MTTAHTPTPCIASFGVSPAESKIIGKLAQRAMMLDGMKRSVLDWRMDFTACHANGCPLRLAEFLAGDDFNFAHDAYGIANTINRDTGKIEGLFRPRFSLGNRPASAILARAALAKATP